MAHAAPLQRGEHPEVPREQKASSQELRATTSLLESTKGSILCAGRAWRYGWGGREAAELQPTGAAPPHLANSTGTKLDYHWACTHTEQGDILVGKDPDPTVQPPIQHHRWGEEL